MAITIVAKIVAGIRHIADIRVYEDADAANARLIAAAPDLLGVLTRLVRRIEQGERITPDLNVMSAAREAIAKARGK